MKCISEIPRVLPQCEIKHHCMSPSWPDLVFEGPTGNLIFVHKSVAVEKFTQHSRRSIYTRMCFASTYSGRSGVVVIFLTLKDSQCAYHLFLYS